MLKMTELFDRETECPLMTDGEIAVVNLNSARRRSWSRFFHDPLQQGVPETVIEHEQLAMQFVGDLFALDRLESMVKELVRVDTSSARMALIQAQVASMAHRFDDARRHLAEAECRAGLSADINRLRLNIDQACGVKLDDVLLQRQATSKKSGRPEDLIALGALLADLGEFAEAERTYEHALREYRGVSPFPAAWIWFQLGVLWGELVPQPQKDQAAECYRRALKYLPGFTNPRVHLAEVYMSCERADEAETLLIPAVSSRNPEVHWRLADLMGSRGRTTDAEAQMEAARSLFEHLLERHLLAFADHGAEFFAGSGDDCKRALDLARVNVANRPTLRAFEQAHSIAIRADDPKAASNILAEARRCWGGTVAFHISKLARGLTIDSGGGSFTTPPPSPENQIGRSII
jgi:tetratricopeptide (TPR) repeat protein